MNDDKYIETDLMGERRLTAYARHNMDECCLVFDISVATHGIAGAYKLECVLNRNDRSGLKFSLDFPVDKNGSVIDKATVISEHTTDLLDVATNLPSTFGAALKWLMKWREMTVEELSEYTLLAPETISRMRSKADYNPTLKSVIVLCIGLQLPPILGHKLIGLAGHVLRHAIKENMMYEIILDGCSTYTIYECNDLLVANDCEPLISGD